MERKLLKRDKELEDYASVQNNYKLTKTVCYELEDQIKELMKVIQRNFRKYFALRTWGWFIIIQKTKPLIGQINLEDELRILEEKANASYGAYKEQLDTKVSIDFHCMIFIA